MKKKLNIPKDFWKDLKDRKDFGEFFNELFKDGINQMLKAEITHHPGYDKNSKEGDNSGNSQNGGFTKTLKSGTMLFFHFLFYLLVDEEIWYTGS